MDHEEEYLPQDPLPETGYNRRKGDNVQWADIEVYFLKAFEKFKVDLIKEVYERGITPLVSQLDEQARFCARHTQELTEVETRLHDIHEAHLIRRMQVMEDRVGLIGRATVIIGGAAITAVFGLVLLLVTGQIRF
jgi:hypothetical protein